MMQRGWFLFAIGLLLGVVLGYVLAEQQAVPPPRAAATASNEALPPGHPPVAGGAGPSDADRALARQAQELEQLLGQSPDDARLMVALGNLYFDAGRWPDARLWYERSLESDRSDPNVLTDLAVVNRNLGNFDRALELLDEAIALAPEHWQAWYNRVVVLNFDLHRHDEAQAAMARLKEIQAGNPQVPDLSALESELEGH
jgi:tetratricopeptide (TPR) repeat protein